MVLVLGIVAVLHESPAELPEPNRQFDTVETVIHASNAIHILAGPPLPFGGILPAPFQNLPFLKVNVDRMAPAAPAVFKVPNLNIALGWRGRQPSRIHA